MPSSADRHSLIHAGACRFIAQIDACGLASVLLNNLGLLYFTSNRWAVSKGSGRADAMELADASGAGIGAADSDVWAI